MKYIVHCVLIIAVLAIVAPPTTAHFKLVEPASWIIENDRGDPQKSGPCGGSNTDWGKPSYIVTKVSGGANFVFRPRKSLPLTVV